MKDALQKCGGASNILITRKLLESVKNAHAKSVIEAEKKKVQNDRVRALKKKEEERATAQLEAAELDLKIK